MFFMGANGVPSLKKRSSPKKKIVGIGGEILLSKKKFGKMLTATLRRQFPMGNDVAKVARHGFPLRIGVVEAGGCHFQMEFAVSNVGDVDFQRKMTL